MGSLCSYCAISVTDATKTYSIHTLADDILFLIFSWLLPKEINSLQKSCKHIHHLFVQHKIRAPSQTYWQKQSLLILQDTPTNHNKFPENWCEFYKQTKQFIDLNAFRARFHSYDDSNVDKFFTIQSVVKRYLNSSKPMSFMLLTDSFSQYTMIDAVFMISINCLKYLWFYIIIDIITIICGRVRRRRI